MSELRELTGRELDAVGGGRLNNFRTNSVPTTLAALAVPVVPVVWRGWRERRERRQCLGTQIGQQINLLSLNGLISAKLLKSVAHSVRPRLLRGPH